MTCWEGRHIASWGSSSTASGQPPLYQTCQCGAVNVSDQQQQPAPPPTCFEACVPCQFGAHGSCVAPNCHGEDDAPPPTPGLSAERRAEIGAFVANIRDDIGEWGTWRDLVDLWDHADALAAQLEERDRQLAQAEQDAQTADAVAQMAAHDRDEALMNADEQAMEANKLEAQLNAAQDRAARLVAVLADAVSAVHSWHHTPIDECLVEVCVRARAALAEQQQTAACACGLDGTQAEVADHIRRMRERPHNADSDFHALAEQQQTEASDD